MRDIVIIYADLTGASGNCGPCLRIVGRLRPRSDGIGPTVENSVCNVPGLLRSILGDNVDVVGGVYSRTYPAKRAAAMYGRDGVGIS
jgi:hypothetical protein